MAEINDKKNHTTTQTPPPGAGSDHSSDDRSENAKGTEEAPKLEVQTEAEKNLAGWQRSQADFANYKRRTEEEKVQLAGFVRQATVAQLLPVLDTLDQALRHAPESTAVEQVKTWQSGLLSTAQQLEKTLQEMGLQKIESVGKQFDPNKHEALRTVPGETDDLVAEEYQVGYEMNGMVVRPSQVAITKKES